MAAFTHDQFRSRAQIIAQQLLDRLFAFGHDQLVCAGAVTAQISATPHPMNVQPNSKFVARIAS